MFDYVIAFFFVIRGLDRSSSEIIEYFRMDVARHDEINTCMYVNEHKPHSNEHDLLSLSALATCGNVLLSHLRMLRSTCTY